MTSSAINTYGSCILIGLTTYMVMRSLILTVSYSVRTELNDDRIRCELQLAVLNRKLSQLEGRIDGLSSQIAELSSMTAPNAPSVFAVASPASSEGAPQAAVPATAIRI